MGHVYILQSGNTNYFKVGRTKNEVEKRIKTLSTGNPHQWTIFGDIETDYASKVEAFLKAVLQPWLSRESDANEIFFIEPTEMLDRIGLAQDYAENDLPKAAEAARLAKEHCEDRWVSPSESEKAKLRELLDLLATIARLTSRAERLKNELKLGIGTAAGMEGIASWEVIEGHRFAEKAFASDHPELYVEYYRETRQRTFRLLYGRGDTSGESGPEQRLAS